MTDASEGIPKHGAAVPSSQKSSQFPVGSTVRDKPLVQQGGEHSDSTVGAIEATAASFRSCQYDSLPGMGVFRLDSKPQPSPPVLGSGFFRGPEALATKDELSGFVPSGYLSNSGTFTSLPDVVSLCFLLLLSRDKADSFLHYSPLLQLLLRSQGLPLLQFAREPTSLRVGRCMPKLCELVMVSS